MATNLKRDYKVLYESFDPNTYLSMRYRNTADYSRFAFPLEKYHDLYAKLCHGSEKKWKILDYGAGPVLMYLISAAQYNVEIVMADIVPECLGAVHQWVERDPRAFDWSAHFDYVVQKLEGKGEKESREREEKLRKAIMATVHCDISQDNPIAMGYDDPYDVVMSNLFLENTCKDLDEYKSAVGKLSGLLKPGGKLTIFTSIGENLGAAAWYGVGRDRFPFMWLNRDFIIRTLENGGFDNIYTDECYKELEEGKASGTVGSWAAVMPEDFRGFLFVSATKV